MVRYKLKAVTCGIFLSQLCVQNAKRSSDMELVLEFVCLKSLGLSQRLARPVTVSQGHF